MNDKGKKKTAPWRIVVGTISIAYIVFMWAKKDIASVYSTMPPEKLFPLIVTNAAVTLVKIVVIAAVIFLIKWIISKVNNKNE